MAERIAKITRTHLGWEGHGILTAQVAVEYGNSAGQSIGGYTLDSFDRALNRRVGTAYGMEWVARFMKACGVNSWEDVAGRTILVITDSDEYFAKVIGIAPLPTEKGARFIFDELSETVAV